MTHIKVYFDGACPACRREMAFYRRFDRQERVDWFDITGEDRALRAEGIDPRTALGRLHVRLADGSLVTGVDAFIVLWQSVPWFRPLAWVASIRFVKARLERWYEPLTRRRLRRSGRSCGKTDDVP